MSDLMKMRIGIMGVGGIGSVVGGTLTKAGYNVTLIDQWPAHVEAMKADGLQISSASGSEVVSVKAMHLYEAQAIRDPFDAAFLAVKAYDTDWATALVARYIKAPDGVVVVFQNGMGDGRVAKQVGRERTLGCVILIAANLVQPGRVERLDFSPVAFKIGELNGRDTERARSLAAVLDAVGPTVLTTNLIGDRWSKLLMNSVFNPLGGLCGSGHYIMTEELPRRVMIQVAAEVVSVAAAAGYRLEPLFGIAAQRFVDAAAGNGLDQVEADIVAIAQRLPGGKPSFLQDVLRGRRTEIDEINGFIVAEGKRLGVPTPFNEAVIREVKRHPVGTLVPDPGNLDQLTRMLPHHLQTRELK